MQRPEAGACCGSLKKCKEPKLPESLHERREGGVQPDPWRPERVSPGQQGIRE